MQIGRILFVHSEVGEYLPNFHPYEDYRRMYASKRELGGGVTLTQIHELDYLYALLGPPRRVFSLGGKLSDLEVDVEDVSSSVIEYTQSGRAVPVTLHQDYVQRPTSRRCKIVGVSGIIEWNLSDSTLKRFNSAGKCTEQFDHKNHPRNQMFMDEMHHFLQCIQETKRPEISLQDGAMSLHTALSILESQRTAEPVSCTSMTKQ